MDFKVDGIWLIETMCAPIIATPGSRPARRPRSDEDPVLSDRNSVIRMLGLAGWPAHRIADALSRPVGPGQVGKILSGPRTSHAHPPDQDPREMHEFHGAEACEHCRLG